MASGTDPQVRVKLLKRKGKVPFRKFHKNGAEHFNIRLYVEGGLSNLESVTYELHPTFRNPVRTVPSTTQGFSLDIWTWGEFDVAVTFLFADGHTSSTVYKLEYSDQLPAQESAYIDETDPKVRGAT